MDPDPSAGIQDGNVFYLLANRSAVDVDSDAPRPIICVAPKIPGQAPNDNNNSQNEI